MEIKVCTKCKVSKSITDFAKDGKRYRSDCKLCNKASVQKYARTKKGLAHTLYNSQKKRSRKYSRQLPTYNYDEFEQWLFSQTNFHVLFNIWKLTGYERQYAPSVDRKDDYLSYAMNNIQLMSWQDNHKKSCEDRKKGINNKISKSIKQYELDGTFIKQFYSIKQASRDMNIDSAAINRCCVGKQRTSCGFLWEYV